MQLTGPQAFYNDPPGCTPDQTYIARTRRDFNSLTPLPRTFVYQSENYETESKIKRIAKIIFAIIIFPVGLYKLIYHVIGLIVVIGSIVHSKKSARTKRMLIPLWGEWKYKRITLEVNGKKIDALIMLKPANANNGKWTVVANGNGGCCEFSAISPTLQGLLTRTDNNAIILNYPGVGASEGLPTRDSLIHSVQAAFAFVERELQATEITGYGFSLGGGVMAEAVATLDPPREGLSRKIFLDRTFCRLSEAAKGLFFRAAGFFIKQFDWELRTSRACKRIRHCRVVVAQQAETYRGRVDRTQPPVRFITDPVIHERATLAPRVLRRDDIVIFGIRENHHQSLGDESLDLIGNELRIAH